MTTAEEARFVARIVANPTTGCNEWLGAISSSGYGNVRIGKREIGAHVAAFLHWRGEIPVGHFVLHHCDNKRCVRPEHLFSGTPMDNVADMDLKGRRRTVASRGAAHGNAKLCDSDVVTIRALRAAGSRVATVAARFSISAALVSHVCNRRVWKHVA